MLTDCFRLPALLLISGYRFYKLRHILYILMVGRSIVFILIYLYLTLWRSAAMFIIKIYWEGSILKHIIIVWFPLSQTFTLVRKIILTELNKSHRDTYRLFYTTRTLLKIQSNCSTAYSIADVNCTPCPAVSKRPQGRFHLVKVDQGWRHWVKLVDSYLLHCHNPTVTLSVLGWTMTLTPVNYL